MPPTTGGYTLSLHDALPIWRADARLLERRLPERRHECQWLLRVHSQSGRVHGRGGEWRRSGSRRSRDRKSTRLNSSHEWISYAVFCLKKKNKDNKEYPIFGR